VRLTSNSRRDAGELDNTLIIFISSDNGTSAERSTVGTPFDQAALEAVDIPVADQLKYYDVWGSDKTQPHMAVAWAWAFDTPSKQIASHFGGTRQGLPSLGLATLTRSAESARRSTT
jgi:arylsulfatase A-like enzyme